MSAATSTSTIKKLFFIPNRFLMYIKARSRKQAQNDDDDVNDDNVNVVDADADAEVDQDEVRVGVSSCRHTLKRVYLVGK